MKAVIYEMKRWELAVWLAVFLVIGFIAGCATITKVLEDPTEPEAYLLARRALNSYWEQYLDVRDAMPDGPEKTAFRAKFKDTGPDSYFTQAKKALDAWKPTIGTEDSEAKKALFDVLIAQIITILMDEGVIKIE